MIYWIYLMEHIIKKLVKSSIQEKLERYTKNKRNAFLVWVWATWLTQSSSLVWVLVLVFVGAGIIWLTSAMWVIAWANIWTTFSSLIIAVLWFWSFSITAFAFPLIAIWWVSLLFVSNPKYKYYLQLLLSLWLIFFGIDLIKDSVESLRTIIDFSQYAHLWILWFFFIWMILTWIIQSSHTVVIMTLAALHWWIITFPMALWIAIWSNIGTTITIVLASLWWSSDKRKVALGHLWFNLVLSIIWLLYYPYITYFITDMLRISDNPMIIIAIFNLILNTITAIVLLPFLDEFIWYIKKFSMHHKPDRATLEVVKLSHQHEKFIKEFPSITLYTILLDCKHLFYMSWRYITQLFNYDIVDQETLIEKKKSIQDTSIYKFLVTLFQTNQALPSEQGKITQETHIQHTLSTIEHPFNKEQSDTLYYNNKTSIEIIFPLLIALHQEELSKWEHVKLQELQNLLQAIVEAMKYAKAINVDIETLRDQKHPSVKAYYEERANIVINMITTILNKIYDENVWEKAIWKLYTQQKSQFKVLQKWSETVLNTITTSRWFAYSTLYNIERHIQAIIKSLLKWVKSYAYALQNTSKSEKKSYRSMVMHALDEQQEPI